MKEIFIPANSESHESLQSYSPAWLAAIFEVASSIDFHTIRPMQKSGIRTYSYPLLTITDSDPDKMQKFQGIVGGRVYVNIKRGSNQWYIMGQPAVDIAIDMAPHAPSRTKIIEAFVNWENAGSMEEKVEIAQEMKSHNRTDVKEEDYENLVRDPDFLAGVIDSRGSIFMSEHISPRGTSYGWVNPQLDINSTNIALLKALRNEYDGHTHINYEKGETIEVSSREYVAKKTSARWGAGDEICNKLAQITEGRIKLNLEGIQLIQT